MKQLCNKYVWIDKYKKKYIYFYCIIHCKFHFCNIIYGTRRGEIENKEKHMLCSRWIYSVVLYVFLKYQKRVTYKIIAFIICTQSFSRYRTNIKYLYKHANFEKPVHSSSMKNVQRSLCLFSWSIGCFRRDLKLHISSRRFKVASSETACFARKAPCAS